MRIERTPLPGIGIRYNFTTESGQEIGVICHVSGNREIVVYETDDTDKVRCTTRWGSRRPITSPICCETS